MVKAVGLESEKAPLMGGRLRSLPFHAINYIIAGSGTFRDARTPEQEIGPGTVFFLYPGLEHCYDPLPGRTWREYWVLFDGVEAEHRFGNLLPGTSLFRLGSDPELIAVFEELYQTFQEQRAETPLLCNLYLHRILGLLFRQYREESPGLAPVVAAVIGHMRRNLAKPGLDFPLLATEHGISYESLRKLFRRQTGSAPLEYFLRLKINTAGNLLLRGHTVKETAAELGFSDQYYFSRLFKRHTGLAPSQFTADRRNRTRPAMAAAGR